MRALITILLITCSSSSAAAEELDRPALVRPALVLRRLASTHPRLLLAPELPELPADLIGLPLRTPAEARCVASGAALGAGVWLPQSWSDYVHTRLEACGMMPARVQAQLDGLATLALVAIDAESRVIVAERAVDLARAQAPAGYALGAVIGWAVGGFLAGAAAVGVLALAM